MSRIEGGKLRGEKAPDTAWCDDCLRDLDLALDDYEDLGEAGHRCAACVARLDPDPEEDDLSSEMEQGAEDLFGLEALNRDEDEREARLEEQHRDALLRERGRQP